MLRGNTALLSRDPVCLDGYVQYGLFTSELLGFSMYAPLHHWSMCVPVQGAPSHAQGFAEWYRIVFSNFELRWDKSQDEHDLGATARVPQRSGCVLQKTSSLLLACRDSGVGWSYFFFFFKVLAAFHSGHFAVTLVLCIMR